MENTLNFLIEIQKLKEFPRTGWVLRKVKNPETIAEHMFRVAMANWVLGREANLNLKKIIEMSLFHDLCEVYAGDVTPFFYYIRDLPKNEKERKKFLRKYVRLLKVEKEKRGREKHNLEKRSLSKLLNFLDSEKRKEIFSLWSDFERRFSKEGDFARQVDKIETLIQAIEYFGTGKKSPANSWWEESEEVTDHPLLLEFLKVIQKKFYGKVNQYRKNEELKNILDFLLEIGKLKKMPRLYWTLRGIKNPETVAGHIFTLSIMAWIFGKKRKELNLEKLLKMALCHELSAVYTGDTTPYDRILSENKKEKEKILARMIRLSRKEKEWIFLRDYKEEEKAMKRLTKNLSPLLKKEIVQLWHEYRTRSSLEAKFLTQLNILAVLLQGLLYEKKYEKFSTLPLWEWAYENCDDEICLSLMEGMKKKFYG
jgi:putative hydrolase of HD superfamily